MISQIVIDDLLKNATIKINEICEELESHGQLSGCLGSHYRF